MKLLRNICISALAFGAVSCNCDCKEQKTDATVSESVFNDLLPKNVTIKYEHNLNIPENSEIMSTIDRKTFVDGLADALLAGSVTAYDPSDMTEVLPIERIQMMLGSYNDTLIGIDEAKADTVLQVEKKTANRKQISRLLFNEEWQFVEESFSMTKKVQSYSPIKVYYRNDDSVKKDIVKKQLLWVKPEDKESSNLSLLKENVTYEFPFYTATSHLWLENLSVGRFAEILIDNVTEGKIPAYDFFEKGKALDVKEVRRRLGETVDFYYVPKNGSDEMDTVEVRGAIYRDEIRSVIFVEDWYLDNSTKQIVKKVKQIAPVRQYVNIYDNGEEDEIKRIVYVVNLN